jgi:hypothetical protein
MHQLGGGIAPTFRRHITPQVFILTIGHACSHFKRHVLIPKICIANTPPSSEQRSCTTSLNILCSPPLVSPTE